MHAAGRRRSGDRMVQGGFAVGAVFVLALIARIGVGLRGGGLRGNYGTPHRRNP